MSVLVQVAQQPEVLSVSVEVIAGHFRRVLVGNPARLLLELPPVTVAVIALDLVCGAGGPPDEAGGESPIGHAAALAGFSTLGGGMYSQATGTSPSRSSRNMPALSMFLRYISRSLCGRPSSRIQAACTGSAWLTIAAVSPGCSRTKRRITSRTR